MTDLVPLVGFRYGDDLACTGCGTGEWLRKRRWFMGRKHCWWCENCWRIAEVTGDPLAHPDLRELDVMLNGFWGDVND